MTLDGFLLDFDFVDLGEGDLVGFAGANEEVFKAEAVEAAEGQVDLMVGDAEDERDFVVGKALLLEVKDFQTPLDLGAAFLAEEGGEGFEEVFHHNSSLVMKPHSLSVSVRV